MTDAFSIVCRAPPSTPVVCGTNIENAAASALFAEKLSTNCDFQQFSYTKELTKPEDVKEVTVHSYWIPKEKAERAILSNFYTNSRKFQIDFSLCDIDTYTLVLLRVD